MTPRKEIFIKFIWEGSWPKQWEQIKQSKKTIW